MRTSTAIPARLAAVLTTGVLLAACSSSQPADEAAGTSSEDIDVDAGGTDGESGDSSSACIIDEPDCNDTDAETLPDTAGEPVDIDDSDLLFASTRVRAAGLLGLTETELAEQGDDIRIGRVGDDVRELTEDYIDGRLTVRLDEVDGELVVTEVVMELPGGPEVYDTESVPQDAGATGPVEDDEPADS